MRALFSILFIVTNNFLFAQFSNLKFENLNTSNGLSSSTCLEIFQDKEGFLWFGTIDGLNKYNGYDFEVFRSVLGDLNSLSNNRINDIEEDNDGNLWIGTNNGLNIYNKGTNKFITIDLYKELSFSNGTQKIINDLLYDSVNNHLWVATFNGVIKIVFGNDNLKIENFTYSYYMHNETDVKSLDSNSVDQLLLDENNKIWAVTKGKHLNHFDALSDSFDRILIDSKKKYELNHIPKKALIDSDGDFWIGNDLSNLILWDKSRNDFINVELVENSTPIRDIFQDEEGMFWVSTDVSGLYLFEKKDLKIKQHIVNKASDLFSLPNNKVSKVFVDKSGIYWFGSYDKGVSKLDPSKNLFGHYYYKEGENKGLSEKTVQSVLQDSKGRIWISAYNGGLNFFNEKKNTFQHIEKGADNSSLSSNKILYTFEDSTGNIWVCTVDRGVNKFNPETNTFKSYLNDSSDSLSIAQNSVWCGVEDSNKRLWFGLRTEGLSLYSSETQSFRNYKNTYITKNGLLSNNILYTYIDSKNRLLIGTFLGLNVLDLNLLDKNVPDKISFSQVKGNGFNETGINYITEDYLGNIWLGTDSGLFKLNKHLELEDAYSSVNGLPNDLVVGIQEDDNHNLWISTKGGISLYNSKTKLFKNFNSQDGLQGLEFQSKSIEKTLDGRIIVGGLNGFNIFHPNDITGTSSKNIKPQIVSFKISNKTVNPGSSINGREILKRHISKTKNIRLKHDENYISFEFVALNFQNSEHIQYAYRMRGLDEEYINIGNNRTVNLSNLNYGDYVFEVKSSIDGNWNSESGTSINVKILPPLWKTWWAYLIYFILGVLCFWLIMKYYTRKVQEKQESELDQMKLRFFVNVSHEFRTPLTLILNPVDKILSNFNNDTETIKKSAKSIQRSARRLLHLVNQLLDYRKMDAGMAPLRLEKGDIVKFSKDIFILFKDIALKKEINYVFSSDLKSVNYIFDFDKVEKIITNLISNALKFTNSGGEIKVSVNKINKSYINSGGLLFKKKQHQDFIEIIVEDTGVGLDNEQQKHIFSRFYNVNNDKTGTGIGLNFTKALVDMHEGEISVESKLNIGSKFIVRLPLDLKSKSETIENIKDEFLLNTFNALEYDLLTTKDSRGDNDISKQEQHKPLILLVEDNKELRSLLNDDLNTQYRIKEAVDGDQGLKMAKKLMPDLIVSDVMMPKMDGFEMCELLKSKLETCHIPIILLTAKTLEEDRIKGYEHGADGYISKPFVANVLKARISNLLEAREKMRKRFSEIGGVVVSSEITTSNLDKAFLDKVTKIVIDNISDVDFDQEQLLNELDIANSQLYRKIKALTGQNPSTFVRTVKLKYAAEKLLSGEYSIKEISYMTGFNSMAYFSKTFKGLFGVTPTQYINSKRTEI